MAMRKIFLFYDFHVIDHRNDKTFFCHKTFFCLEFFVWSHFEFDACLWKIRAIIVICLIFKPAFLYEISKAALKVFLCMVRKIPIAFFSDDRIISRFGLLVDFAKRFSYHAFSIRFDTFGACLIIFFHYAPLCYLQNPYR